MTPKLLARIMIDTADDYEKWYKKHGKETEKDSESVKEAMETAYCSGTTDVIAKVSAIIGDNLEKSNEEEDIPEGKAVETYVLNLFTNALHSILDDAEKEDREKIEEVMESGDLFNQYVLQLFKTYTGKPDLGMEDDDGVNGEEADIRHYIFDNVAYSIPAIQKGKVKKESIVNALHGIADFFDKNL